MLRGGGGGLLQKQLQEKAKKTAGYFTCKRTAWLGATKALGNVTLGVHSE